MGICENIIEQMKPAKYWSEYEKMWYGNKGLLAIIKNNIMPLKEKKQKMKYFLPIIEEALHIRQGVDGPNTSEKSLFEYLKMMCEAVLPLDEKEYRRKTSKRFHK